MARRTVALIAALVAMGAACASLEGLQGEQTDAGETQSVEAGPGGNDGSASPADVVLDTAPSADVTAKADASAADADAGSIDATPPVPFCMGVDAAICDDFERGNAAFGWKGAWFGDGGSVQITNARSTSPTRSVRTALGPMAGQSVACLTSELYPATTAARVSFDIFLASIGGPERASVFQFYITDGASTKTADIRLANGSTALEIVIYPSGGNPTTESYTLSRNLQTGVWEHVMLEFLIGSSGAAKVQFGNDVVLPQAPFLSTPNTVGVNTALIVTSPTGPWEAFLDNFLLEVK